MRFEPGYFAQVVPQRDPPDFMVRELLGPLESLLARDEPATLRRSRLWTHAIHAELRAGAAEPDGYLTEAGVMSPRWQGALREWPRPQIAVGLLDPEYEGAGFGLTVLAPGADRSHIVGRVAFPRLDAVFPLAILALGEDAHAAPRLLANAAATCWALDDLARGDVGFITCSHAVTGKTPGMGVALIGQGLRAWITRKAPATIDAAFLTTDVAPTKLRPMPLYRTPTAGDPITVATPSGVERRVVISVTDTLGVINSHHLPISIFFDRPCQPGDSGSLLSMATGEGIGIYRGELIGATVGGQAGQTAGFAQHLEQAATILNVTPLV